MDKIQQRLIKYNQEIMSIPELVKLKEAGFDLTDQQMRICILDKNELINGKTVKERLKDYNGNVYCLISDFITNTYYKGYLRGIYEGKSSVTKIEGG